MRCAVRGQADGGVDGRLVTWPSRTLTRMANTTQCTPTPGAVKSLGHVGQHPVGALGDGLTGDVGAVHRGQVAGHLGGGSLLAVSKSSISSMPCRRRWRFLTRCDSRALPAAWHVQRYRPDFGQHRLAGGAVSGVATVATLGGWLIVAEVLGDLRLQAGFAHLLGQPRQRPSGRRDLDSLRGLVDESAPRPRGPPLSAHA